ncbi:hypothetical protein B7P43_G08136, partial [Cryptotermes secundus]
LKNVYGDDAVDRSSVSRWARRLSGESGHANIRDPPRTGRPQPAQTPDNVQRVGLKEMSVQLGNDKASVCRIFKHLGLKRVCARWVPRMLTDAHKETRKLCAVNSWHSMRIVEMIFLREM